MMCPHKPPALVERCGYCLDVAYAERQRLTDRIAELEAGIAKFIDAQQLDADDIRDLVMLLDASTNSVCTDVGTQQQGTLLSSEEAANPDDRRVPAGSRSGSVSELDATKDRFMRIYSAEVWRARSFGRGEACPFCGWPAAECNCDRPPVIKRSALQHDLTRLEDADREVNLRWANEAQVRADPRTLVSQFREHAVQCANVARECRDHDYGEDAIRQAAVRVRRRLVVRAGHGRGV